MPFDAIPSLLANAAISIGSSLAALGGVYLAFGDKLLSHFLNKRLQQEKARQEAELQRVKHGQDEQIEALRAEIGHLADRGKRSNEREYSALSSLWEKYVDLHYATHVCVMSFVQHPDLRQMSEAEIEEFLQTTEFSKEQKTAVLKAQDRNQSFSRITINRYINKAQSELYELNLLLHKQGIFIPKDLKRKFEAGGKLCSAAIATRYVAQGGGTISRVDEAKFLEEGPSTLESTKDMVRDRLLHE